MKRRHYIILAISSYLLFTLAYTPAASIVSLVEKTTALPVKLNGVSGSIWHGHVDQLNGQIPVPLKNLNWSINLLPLLLGSLDADIDASIRQQKVYGRINASITGRLSGHEIQSEIPAADMQKLLDIPIGEFAGKFFLYIDSITHDKEGLPQVSATINWKSASFTMAQTVDLGDVELNIRPDDKNGLLAKIKNRNAKLGIEGSVQILANKQYNADISFKPQDNDPGIEQSLAMFARKQANGSYRLQKAGNINQLGF